MQTINNKVVETQLLTDKAPQAEQAITHHSNKIMINKKAVQASFSKAASHYDRFADLQREIGHHLLQLMPTEVTQAQSALDLGCGTGYFSTQLRDLCQQARLTCLDLSQQMLQQTALRALSQCQYVQGDIDALPFTAGQFDLIFSNLVLQWSENLSVSLQQTKHALDHHGALCFSTLLAGSLFELEQAWKKVDNQIHVNNFLTQQQVISALQLAGYERVQLSTETRVKKYPDVISVLKALKGIGANHVHQRSTNQASSRQVLKQLEAGYQPFKDKEGWYALSYQVCYIVAHKAV